MVGYDAQNVVGVRQPTAASNAEESTMAGYNAEHIVGVFKYFDTNADDCIDRQELARGLRAIEPEAWNDARLDQIIKEADVSLDGRIQLEELIWWVLQRGEHQSALCCAVDKLVPHGSSGRVGLPVVEGDIFHCDDEMPLFESPTSDDVIRRLGEGVEVIAAGAPEEVDGYLMLPIKPRGAVEFDYLKPGCDACYTPEVDPDPPRWELYGMIGKGPVKELVEQLVLLPAMDKNTMSGPCASQTFAMEDFMQRELGMRPRLGEYFVQGVYAFELQESLCNTPPSKELVFRGINAGPHAFRMSREEVLGWQSSFRTYYAADEYVGTEGAALLCASLQGKSRAGQEAWMMKFAVRCSINPVIMKFDGQVVQREVGDATSARIYLISVCGIDFAGRVHDRMDLTSYISNWSEVYELDKGGEPVVEGGRDFVPTGLPAVLNVQRLLSDLKKMARLRLRAQDALGIEVVVEVGVGLGVFAGDDIDIGKRVRTMSALALRHVLETERFEHIKLVVVSVPIFRRHDNIEFFSRAFSKFPDRYDGCTPVLVMDQDMHAIALAAAKAGFKVGELNPADSHGVFGEYWQNLGPGTEEKLALTTCGLLTQHHAVNPAVLDVRNYIRMEC